MSIFWWIPVLIPLAGVIVLFLSPLWPIARWEGATSKDQMEKNWIKFGIYAAINFIACALIAWVSWCGAVAKTKFPEIWNFQIIGICHEMEWTTEEMHTRQVPDGVDKDGHTTYRTEIYSVTEHHGPYWYCINEYGDRSHINRSKYDHWRVVWNNEKQTGMHRGSSAGWDRSIDGPIYSCFWPQTFDTIWPETEIRNYVNKIRASHSVLNYGEATSQQKAKFPRPADKGNALPIIIYGGLSISDDEMLFLKRVNASFGRKYEVHPILIVFGRDEARGVVTNVLTAWQGPNKNELVTFLALDGQTIRWVEIHSWMDNTTLHATLRDELMGQSFTVKRYGELLQEYVPKLWHRKHFTPINAYLHVSIHPGWILLGFTFSIVVAIVSYFVINRVVDDRMP